MTVNRIKSLGIITVLIVLALSLVDSANAQDYKEDYNTGLEAAKAKNLTVALDSFTKAADGAKAEGDADIERRARRVIAQIEYNLGRSALSTEKYDEAIAHFDNGITQYPTYAKNFLGKASTLKKKGDLDEAIAVFAQTIAVAMEASDTKTTRQAETAIREQYIFLASSALSRNGNSATRADADEAFGYLEALQSYVNPDSDVYYYLAEIHKIKGEFQDVVAQADLALSAHKGSRTDKAKIYFVKGEALMILGDTAGAKSAFVNAQFGTYKASARHFIETLGTN